MEFNNDLIPATNNDQNVGASTAGLVAIYLSNPTGTVKKVYIDASNDLVVGTATYLSTASIQTTVTDDDTKVTSGGAVVDYAVDLARVETTVTDDDAKVPSSGAVVAIGPSYSTETDATEYSKSSDGRGLVKTFTFDLTTPSILLSLKVSGLQKLSGNGNTKVEIDLTDSSDNVLETKVTSDTTSTSYVIFSSTFITLFENANASYDSYKLKIYINPSHISGTGYAKDIKPEITYIENFITKTSVIN